MTLAQVLGFGVWAYSPLAMSDLVFVDIYTGVDWLQPQRRIFDRTFVVLD